MQTREKGGGEVWVQQQQFIAAVLQRLVQSGALGKVEEMAIRIGMTRNEFFSKFSISPRTPARRPELLMIEHEIRTISKPVYNDYLGTWHLNKDIRDVGGRKERKELRPPGKFLRVSRTLRDIAGRDAEGQVEQSGYFRQRTKDPATV